jgi:hypothetical protein
VEAHVLQDTHIGCIGILLSKNIFSVSKSGTFSVR